MENQKVLLYVNYDDDTGKYWQDSTILNKVFTVEKDIHETIRKALEEFDYVKLSYKGKPQGNIYRDKADGGSYIVGYHYRGKTEIQNEKTGKWVKVPLTVWVDISLVVDYQFEEINE